MRMPFKSIEHLLHKIVYEQHLQHHRRIVYCYGKIVCYVVAEGAHGGIVVRTHPLSYKVGEAVHKHRCAGLLSVFKEELFSGLFAEAVFAGAEPSGKRCLLAAAEHYGALVAVLFERIQQHLRKAEIAFAEFEIYFNTDRPEEVKAYIEEKISASEIIVEKKAKQGRKKVLKPVDIKGNIHTYELETGEKYVLLKIIISAGTKTNINPSLLIDAVTAEVKDDIESVDIKKNKMLLEDLTQFE